MEINEADERCSPLVTPLAAIRKSPHACVYTQLCLAFATQQGEMSYAFGSRSRGIREVLGTYDLCRSVV